MASFAERFREPYAFRAAGVALELEQEPGASLARASLDTGCTVWPSAVALARAALEPAESCAAATAVRGARVVELGAGTGLAGLACAAAGAEAVIMTDLPARLPLLARNAARNGWVRTIGGCAQLGVEPLDWADAEGALAESAALRGADATLLIGADLVHDADQCAPLARCVAALLRAWPRCERVLWAQQPHCALAAAELRGRLEREAGLSFELLREFEGGGRLLLGRVAAAAGAAAPAAAGGAPRAAKRARAEAPAETSGARARDGGAGGLPSSVGRAAGRAEGAVLARCSGDDGSSSSRTV
ncbi:hypothetical protein KFE25_005294 [Diacronema lutheri]|uniref:Calmodulin-lysine N-methyltransferase n=1 Tax=Diacronema lutheri TaxID=2081491 RepID=A0A8J5XSG4_DIALT|nr:hypothetical protein KFE25_005294 [Diacronema lutheri]